MKNYCIRKANIDDVDEISQLFTNTIRTINTKDYTIEETADWASCGKSESRWIQLITELYFILAINDNNQIVGFASLSEKGYLHSMFVHAEYQGKGIASLLYRNIEDYAYQQSIKTLTSEVSITARAFFERQGFVVDTEQKRKANRLYLVNYKMSKKLKKLQEMTNEELWKLFPINLSEYSSDWISLYHEEKQNLERIISDECISRINHIGSTAVPGLLSKPTIDILLEIYPETNTSKLIQLLECNGYIYAPQPHKPAPYMMFMKGYTIKGFEGQTFHIHIRYPDDWDELYFRDYLIDHPDTANEYAQLKQLLKDKYEFDRDAYTNAKSGFIIKITTLARNDYPGRYTY